MKVTNELRVYELNGKETHSNIVQESRMEVTSHWNSKDKVNLKYQDTILTVLVSDLQRAIQNASNHI